MRTLRIAFTLAIATLLFTAAVWGQAAAPAQGQQAAQASPWKDRAEYDLYDSATKQTDNAKKLEILNTWKQKYPDSKLKLERLQLIMQTQAALNQAAAVLVTGEEILAIDPKNLAALFMVARYTLLLPNASPQQLSLGEKAARALVTDTDSLRPSGMPDANWTAAKAEATTQGHTTLGVVAMLRKENEVAEKEFTTLLQANPNDAQSSYRLGTVILAQRNPDKQSAGLFHVIRAAFYTGPGALAPEGRKQIENYITSTYKSFHGSMEGFDELRKEAVASAFPPSDLRIKSAAQVALEDEEKFKQENPRLALWMSIKKALQDPGGATYFENSMKGALLPGGAGGVSKFRGVLIEAKPAKNPKQLILAISDAETPEVTLNFEEALVGTADKGRELEFEGVPASYTTSPQFNVTFDVEKEQLTNWPAPAPAGKKGPTGGAGTKKNSPTPAKKG